MGKNGLKYFQKSLNFKEKCLSLTSNLLKIGWQHKTPMKHYVEKKFNLTI